jgi:predicted DNA-binding transcriptional regulator AlpA
MTGNIEFLRARDLLRGVVPFSRATLYRRIADGSFPRGVKVSPRVTAWPRAVVEAWVARFQGEGARP